MRFRRLTGLERDKIQNEYNDLLALIADLADILAKPERVIAIIKEELDESKRKFEDKRRTELMVVEVFLLKMKISSKKKMSLSHFQIKGILNV